MNSSIFLIGVDDKLTELTRSPYDSEDMLQRLIASHPEVLGAATGADGGLLLVKREYGVPDAQDRSGRWSLDHLFLDRNSVPTLVEVKRATDTRARREVVAQMLDYAANGVAYWPIDSIVQAFRASCEAGGLNPDAKLAEFLGDDDPEDYWKATEANLRSGRIRMVFLADEIGKELGRIVEFLNEQMRPAEVLAVEVVQYLNSSNGVKTLVPKLVGATERAKSAKSVNSGDRSWLQSIVEAYDESAPDELKTHSRGRNYRQIKPFPGHDPVHYEFLLHLDEQAIGVEFHVENKKYPKLSQALSGLFGKLRDKYQGYEVKYDPKWYRGGRIGILFPQTAAARTIADTMHRLITDTRADVEELIKD